MRKIPNEFPITVFEDNSTKISDTLTKQRVRIFYKGLNRNGSYISDEFAEKLIQTLPYTPVKGIYDEDSQDYTSHGNRRDEGRIYGVVPEQFNFAWEQHTDEDGVTREYACADVYLFTALYDEADQIVGKSQSMELYPPSIKGNWVSVGDTMCFKYSDASFLGLQVLGDKTIPCFEGSSFFELKENQQLYSLFTILLEKIDKLSIGGFEPMEKEQFEFALSDNQKQDVLFKALNQDKFRYIVVDNYSDYSYAIVYDLEDDRIKKMNYSVDAESGEITVGESEEVYSEYLTAEEYAAVTELRDKTEEKTYASIVIKFNENENTIETMKSEFEEKVQEISTLQMENETLNQKFEAVNSQITEYEQKLNELTEYKLAIETAQKNAVIDKYSEKLSEETVQRYRDTIQDYDLHTLEKELAFELVKSDSTIFSSQPQEGYVPTDNVPTGLEALLLKHQK